MDFGKAKKLAGVRINKQKFGSVRSIDIVGGVVRVNGEIVDVGETPNGILEIRVLDGVIGELNSDMSVTCGEVHGNVTAGMSVNCGNVAGNVTADMSINCGDIQGNAKADMSINAGAVHGRAS